MKQNHTEIIDVVFCTLFAPFFEPKVKVFVCFFDLGGSIYVVDVHLGCYWMDYLIVIHI